MDNSFAELITAISKAPTLVAIMLLAWQLTRLIAVKVVEEELNERAQ